MEEIAQVYSRSLFEVAKEHDRLDLVKDQLGVFADALDENREEMLDQTRRDIEAETRRAIQEIRNEVAELTVLATEKVTRKSLDEADQRRLVDEALAELDFSALSGNGESR